MIALDRETAPEIMETQAAPFLPTPDLDPTKKDLIGLLPAEEVVKIIHRLNCGIEIFREMGKGNKNLRLYAEARERELTELNCNFTLRLLAIYAEMISLETSQAKN